MDLQQEVSRGTQAKHILEHELFQEAVNKVQADIFDKFASLDPVNKEGMVIERLRLKCLADITRNLQDVMNTGVLAEAEIKRQQTMADKAFERIKKGIRAVI